MDYRLPVLTVGVVIAGFGIYRAVTERDESPIQVTASPSTPAPAEPVTSGSDAEGAKLIFDAIEQLSRQQTIAAKVRHRTQIFGHRLVGSGVYLQRKAQPDPLVRFSLSIQAGERSVSLLHICDGRFLWIRENFEPPGSLSRIDLRRIRSGDDGLSRSSAPVTSLSGGIVQLLRSLQDNFEFDAPHSLTFQDVPVWAITCRWKTDRLAAYLSKKHSAVGENGQIQFEELPSQVPNQVLVLLGKDDLFPYHIDFRRRQGLGSESEKHTESLVTMELFEVQFNAPINPTLFAYKPGDIEITDGTDEYLAKQRRLARLSPR